MIPTMIVFGLVFGRWWKTTLIAGGMVWTVMLAQQGITTAEFPGVVLFGLVNTAIGVGIHQGILYLVRRVRRARPMATSPSL